MPAAMLALAVTSLAAAADLQPPRAIVAGSFSEADYPAEAVGARAEGTSVVDVDIDAAGRVSSCRIAQSAGNGALDTRTCQIFSQRFRFAPAAAPSSRRLRIAWRLPTAPAPVPFAAARVSVETVAVNSGANYCRTTSVGRPPAALFAIACDAGARTAPPPANWLTRRLDTVTLTADGSAPPALPRVRSTLLLRYQVAFEVGADGRVTGCTPSGGLDKATAAAARQRCDALANGGAPVFAPGAGGRHGMIEAVTTLQTR